MNDEIKTEEPEAPEPEVRIDPKEEKAAMKAEAQKAEQKAAKKPRKKKVSKSRQTADKSAMEPDKVTPKGAGKP